MQDCLRLLTYQFKHACALAEALPYKQEAAEVMICTSYLRCTHVVLKLASLLAGQQACTDQAVYECAERADAIADCIQLAQQLPCQGIFARHMVSAAAQRIRQMLQGAD